MEMSQDLNLLGRMAYRAYWFINNVRVRVVGTLITGLMLLMLIVGGGSVTFGLKNVYHIHANWDSFHSTVAVKFELLDRLRSNFGYGGVAHAFQNYVISGNDESRRRVTSAISEVRSIIPAYASAGVAPKGEKALAEISKLVGEYERALPVVGSARSEGKAADAILAETRIGDAAGIAALATLSAELRSASADRSDGLRDAVTSLVVSILGSVSLNGILLLILAVFLYWFSRTRISRPLDLMRDGMLTLSHGSRDIDIRYTEKQDEIGDMARSLEVFRDNAVRMDDLVEQERKGQEEKANRQREVESSIHLFDEDMSEAIDKAGKSLEEMSATAARTVKLAEQTGDYSSMLADGAAQTMHEVRDVSSAAELLTISCQRITESVRSTAEITQGAVEEAQRSGAIIEGLSGSATRINDVVELIRDIATQTHLLALNATIESARAGEAGKGFAIVAEQVKALANETASATDKIADQISEIQDATRNAVDAMNRIGGTIEDINAAIDTISETANEQTEVAGNIASSSEKSVSLGHTMEEQISKVSEAAVQTGTFSTEVINANKDVSENMKLLRERVETFLKEVGND